MVSAVILCFQKLNHSFLPGSYLPAGTAGGCGGAGDSAHFVRSGRGELLPNSPKLRDFVRFGNVTVFETFETPGFRSVGERW